MTSKAVSAYLGLGSNMGNRRQNLERALDLLSRRLRIGRVSSIYDTEPVDNTNQPRFLNQVCQVHTMLAPLELLTLGQGIELMLGRAPGTHGAPRPLDIDILLYGNQVIKTAELVIPHPRLIERAFVLIPLAEIAPDLVHPLTGKTIRQLLEEVGGKEGVVKRDDG